MGPAPTTIAPRFRLRVAMVACAIAAPLAGAPVDATGQEAAPTLIRLERPAGSRFGLVELSRGRVTVFADGTECASLVPRGDVEIVSIGTADQPDACRRDGAALEIENGAGQLLFETPVLRSGSTFVLENFAPRPPHAAGRAVARPEPIPEAPPLPLFPAASSLLVALLVLARRAVAREQRPRSA